MGPESIPESKDMKAIFQKKGKKEEKRTKKEQNILKFGQKYTKFENVLKNSRLCAIFTHNKWPE